MTHYDTPQEVADFFVLRDTVAELLKAAGVKKHSRSSVAEVLIEAGVIDLDVILEGVTEPDDDNSETEWRVGDRAIWQEAGRHGEIVAIDENLAGFRGDGSKVTRSLPFEWLVHE